MAGRKTKRGTSGNAVKYVTRNQALKKLQLHLGEFRRLCILKGIHPREPNKKTQGQNKTYYHVKDLSFLAHEPLVAKLREQHAYEKKVRKARAKRNAELAAALASRRPTYTLDRLVKERYPSFMDALRDLDDPLTLCHLFAVLPAEGAHGIPAAQVAMSRRIGLEWQAYVVRSHSLRKIFISVKGFFLQAEVLGQAITWLVPHQLPQVLPNDVDYRVMLTFLEFYHTLMRFVLFRLYRDLGASYPPRVDEKLEAAAAGITALMTDLAASSAPAPLAIAAQPPASAQQPSAARLPHAGKDAQTVEPQPTAAVKSTSAGTAVDDSVVSEDGSAYEDESDDEADDELLSINSGGRSFDEELGDYGNAVSAPEPEAEPEQDDEKAATHSKQHQQQQQQQQQQEQQAKTSADKANHSNDAATTAAAVVPAGSTEQPSVGGALSAAPEDDDAICATLFQNLVFFLGREVPREVLLLVIRSFGGVAAWDGEGSPYHESDDGITHQVVDRPKQEHRFLSRAYIQPQWIVDAANFRVLPDVGRYAPGAPPPPHVSPFAPAGTDGEEHVPDYQKELQRLQEATQAARRRAQNGPNAAFLLEQAAEEVGNAAADDAAAAPSATTAATAEAAYLADLHAEMRDAGDLPSDVAPAVSKPIELPTEEDALVADMLLPRKKRKLYASVVKAQTEKRSRTAALKERAAQAAAAATPADS